MAIVARGAGLVFYIFSDFFQTKSYNFSFFALLLPRTCDELDHPMFFLPSIYRKVAILTEYIPKNSDFDRVYAENSEKYFFRKIS